MIRTSRSSADIKVERKIDGTHQTPLRPTTNASQPHILVVQIISFNQTSSTNPDDNK